MQPQTTLGNDRPPALGARCHWQGLPAPKLRVLCAAGVLLLVALVMAGPPTSVYASPLATVDPGASCAALAHMDPTATNGEQWGKTIFPGHGAANGWFGVDACSNGIDSVSPNGSSVSCDRVPSSWAKTGCAPGRPSSDGFGWTFQCVELAVRFSAWAFGDSPADWGRSGWGNAPDVWLAVNHPSDFVMYPNGSATPPVPGDLLVWGHVDGKGQPWPAGPDGAHGGHIAVVAAVHGGVVTTVEQNVKWGNDDHPSDRLALVKVGSQWILSGSIQHQTKLPTYRWLATMGTSRATYGWLHSVHNTGKFPSPASHGAHALGSAPAPSTHAASTPAAKSQTAAKPQTATARTSSTVLPSLAPAALVVSGGALADLAWTTDDRFSASPSDGSPRAQVRSLGGPPGVALAGSQTPSTVVLPSGARYVYAVGVDGHLYSAATVPNVLGITWTDLGAPPDMTLQPLSSATAFAGGVGVAALASDGTLWWRAGPAGAPGAWQSLGQPAQTSLATGFVLVGAPGSGTPTLLALGGDGLLYERVWQAALLNPDGTVQVPAGWSDWLAVHAQPAGVRWQGTLLAVPEALDVQNWVGSWPDVPLEVLVLDSVGHLWQLRSVSGAVSWSVTQVSPPHPLTTLLAATVVAGAASSTSAPSPPTTPTTPAPIATPTSSGGSSASPATSPALHLYAATADALVLGALPLPGRSSGPNETPAWTSLAAPAKDTASHPASVALAVAPATSALVIAVQNELRVGAVNGDVVPLFTDPPAQSDPSTSSSTQPAASVLSPAWASLGTAVAGAPFDDALTAAQIGSGWSPRGAGASFRSTSAGTALVPSTDGVAALLQSVPPGDVALSVQLALPAHLAPHASAGLLLYLDNGDWISLLVDGSGQIGMCVMAGQKSVPCSVLPSHITASTRALWLRIERRGLLYSGATSLDGRIWHAAGQWLAALPPSAAQAAASSSATATATAAAMPSPTAPKGGAPTVAPTPTPTSASPRGSTAAPLAFTEWGLWTQAPPGTDDGIRFLNLTEAPVPGAAP